MALRIQLADRPIRREVVWFASGGYSREDYPADITLFRQHDVNLPTEAVVDDHEFVTMILDLGQPIPVLEESLATTTRYEIRRARREGVTIRKEARDFDAFLERHRRFNRAKRLGAALDREQIARCRGNVRLYSAWRATDWFADLLLIHDDARIRQWVMVNDFTSTDRAILGYASRLLVWHSIELAKAEGFARYDFGGIVREPSDPRHGITRFKASFGGSELVERDSIVIPSRALRNAFRLLRATRVHS